MLSSQMNDEVTDAAVVKLQTVLSSSVSVKSILVANKSMITDVIGKV